MSLGECIPGMIERGEISATRGKAVQEKYDALLAYYRGQMGEGAAKARASAQTVEQLTAEAALQSRRTFLASAAQSTMTGDMARYKGKGGATSPDAAKAVLVRDDRAPYLSLEYRWKVVRDRAHATMDQVLLKHRNDLLGRTRDKEGFDRVIDEMHGDKTGDLNAAEMADGARTALEMLRVRANEAGANIGKLENYGLQHNHHSGKVGDAGFEAWREFVMPKLDRIRMQDRSTGLPFTDAALDAQLRDTFRAIETEGWSRREPGGMGRSSLASQMSEERFLHFKSGADWRAYHERFGVGSVYDALMNQIDRTSRNIAMMETLGPNPSAGLKWLQDSVEKAAAEGSDRAARAGAEKGAKKLETLFDEITGANRQPFDRRIAVVGSALRSWQVATKLGSATLSTTSDIATMQLTKAFNGLPQTGTLSGYIKHLNPASIEDRAHAIRMGLNADDYGNSASTQGRYLSEELVGEIPRRVAETVLRVSGLNAVTQAERFTFGKDFIAEITRMSGRDMDQLNPLFRGALERYGIDRASWDMIRATPLRDERGATWLFPTDIADRKLGDRVLGMIEAETDMAVPVGGIEVSAMVNSAMKSGTILGEIGRTGFQFKGFAATVTMMHARRVMAMTSWQGRAGYVAAMLGLTTIAGAMALQMKEIAKGRDPKPMDDWAFWGASAFQGGGLGIYGDFLRQSDSRFGQSFTDVLKGPAWQTVEQLNALTLDAVWDAADPETDVNYGARVTRALKSETPGGSLWYLRLGFERILLDQLQEQIDPNFRQSRARTAQRAKDEGTDYWAPPGSGPGEWRAPDLGNALGR